MGGSVKSFWWFSNHSCGFMRVANTTLRRNTALPVNMVQFREPASDAAHRTNMEQPNRSYWISRLMLLVLVAFCFGRLDQSKADVIVLANRTGHEMPLRF